MFPFNFMSNPKAALGTLYLRYFGLAKIPLLFFVKPSVVEWTPEKVVFKIPLIPRQMRHVCRICRRPARA